MLTIIFAIILIAVNAAVLALCAWLVMDDVIARMAPRKSMQARLRARGIEVR